MTLLQQINKVSPRYISQFCLVIANVISPSALLKITAFSMLKPEGKEKGNSNKYNLTSESDVHSFSYSTEEKKAITNCE